MSDNRQRIALTEPPADLGGFPTTDTGGRTWFRAHRAGRGAWWFAHDGSGRFDLAAPSGTCYLGSTVEVAVRERLGETLSRAGMVSAVEAERMAVSQLHVDATIADATSRDAARFGVTRELGTITPYDLPQRWASALHGEGHAGLRYWPRFVLDADGCAAALFGRAGAADGRRTDPAPLAGREAAREAGVLVVGIPRRVPTVEPPRA